MREVEFTARLRSGAAEIAAAVNPTPSENIRKRGDLRRRRAIVMSGVLTFALGAGGGGAAYASLGQPGHGAPPVAGPSVPPSSFAASSASAVSSPGIVAVTTAGAVQVFDSATGVATATLAPAGADALGDAVAVSPSGSTVYFSVRRGCTDDIESVPVSGGTPAVVTTGVLPAISPDGRKLAFVREPFGGGLAHVRYDCSVLTASPGKQFQVVIRDLASGSEKAYPAPPGEATALPFPISHLSWAPSGKSLLVSAGPSQDNEGWGLTTLDVANARYYLPASWPAVSAADVPVTGQAGAGQSYYREGVFLPSGDMFVNRICCAGVPVRDTSSLLQEIDSSGRLVRQVAIGFTNRDHTSLAARPGWLLYLSAHDLFVSRGGGPPVKITTGLIAAAWLP
jgi:hypothetical protein